MAHRRSLGWPITLGAVMIALLVALIIGWVLLAAAASHFARYWWGVLAVGTTFLVLVLVGVVLYLALSVKEINLNQRQANFIDSVTHELKSPLASLKLYLQTLTRRNVTEMQQADFFRYMLEDVERLDSLINHLLDAARVEQEASAEEGASVLLSEMLEACASTACQRHRVPEDVVGLKLEPASVRGRLIDIEMIFRNLIDNAIKYSGDAPRVEIESWLDGRGQVVVRIADNGPGIPTKLRRKIFGRFVRLGTELERSKPGTGLGLFIVRTLVKRMRGSISVRSQATGPGTVFEVQLPAGPVIAVPSSEPPAPAASSSIS
ncbi:MAG TPA: HAMP domain-containing sensor histidine kinase [Pirellulales bacterium]